MKYERTEFSAYEIGDVDAGTQDSGHSGISGACHRDPDVILGIFGFLYTSVHRKYGYLALRG
jgi:hypothetical protein